MKKLTTLISLILSAVIIHPLTALAADTKIINHNITIQILKQNSQIHNENFREFLQQITKEQQNTPLRQASNLFMINKKLNKSQWSTIYQLLSIYARLKYQNQMLATLNILVSIDTAKKLNIAQQNNPNIHKFATAIKQLATAFDLQFTNIDNRIFVVTLKGSGNHVLGLYAHADVVPANPKDWVLNNGVKLNPFHATLLNSRIYGRGTLDDKGAIVNALYAMHAIKQAGIPLKRSVRLIIDTAEEIIGNNMPYYLKRFNMPQVNIGLDGNYPVVNAEKGFGLLKIAFNLNKNAIPLPHITQLVGGDADNRIPKTAYAIIKTDHPQKLQHQLKYLSLSFKEAHPQRYTFTITAHKQNVTVLVTGKAAHSSEPQDAVNPTSHLLVFLDTIRSSIKLHDNTYLNAAKFFSKNFGLDYYGKKLSIAYSDKMMGPLTVALTKVGVENDKLILDINLRTPRGKSRKCLISEIKQKLEHYRKQSKITFNSSIILRNPMFHNPHSPLVTALLQIYQNNTGQPGKAISIAGESNVHNIPYAVTFGPDITKGEYMGHVPNEFITLNNFLLNQQLYTNMILAIGRNINFKE